MERILDSKGMQVEHCKCVQEPRQRFRDNPTTGVSNLPILMRTAAGSGREPLASHHCTKAFQYVQDIRTCSGHPGEMLMPGVVTVSRQLHAVSHARAWL